MYLSDLIPESRPLARLIVLSACETGNGRFYRGEGVFSFNRGFAAMGIPASVSNLWSVDNNATYRITELFYQYLSKGLPADLALQKAKLDFIATAGTLEQQLPYYWAASIVIGKSDAIYHPRPSPWWWIAGSAVILLLAFLAFRLYKRKSRS
jgi:CHAT domain-containing protein